MTLWSEIRKLNQNQQFLKFTAHSRMKSKLRAKTLKRIKIVYSLDLRSITSNHWIRSLVMNLCRPRLPRIILSLLENSMLRQSHNQIRVLQGLLTFSKTTRFSYTWLSMRWSTQLRLCRVGSTLYLEWLRKSLISSWCSSAQCIPQATIRLEGTKPNRLLK